MEKKKILFSILIILSIVILVPITLEYALFRNAYYSAINNESWAGFYGSYIGGIVGGIGTLIAVLITTNETRKIQKENDEKFQKETKKQEYNERKIFTDEIASLVAKYISQVNLCYNNTKNEVRLIDELKELNKKKKDTINKLQEIQEKEKESKITYTDLNKLNSDIQMLTIELSDIKDEIRFREIERERYQIINGEAVECYILLGIKLQDITEGKELLKRLKILHDNRLNIDQNDLDWLRDRNKEARKEVVSFINKYLHT